ncbi:hypothetical protein RIF29_08592 [Crotalaria pallida]|uniref:Uncharacterized protein n=1 Tax=Crotalaria pallida TaxID=3830 RepID=A0AAN9FR07_CROPI
MPSSTTETTLNEAVKGRRMKRLKDIVMERNQITVSIAGDPQGIITNKNGNDLVESHFGPWMLVKRPMRRKERIVNNINGKKLAPLMGTYRNRNFGLDGSKSRF